MRPCSQLLPVLLLSVNSAFAVNDSMHYAMQHFTDENGLPQNSVKFIAPDNTGFIWLATENGLVRFEGGNLFRTYNKNHLDITSSRIACMYPSAGKAELLVQTEFRELVHVSNGNAWLPERTPAKEDTGRYTGFSKTAGIYAIAGLPDMNEKNIRATNYLLPVDDRSHFRIGNDTVAFIQSRQKSYSLRFPHASPWKFFILSHRLHYLNEFGQFMALNREGMKPVTLTGDLLHHPAYSTRKPNMELYWNVAAKQLFIYLERSCYLLQSLPDGRINTLRVATGFNFETNRIVSVYYDTSHHRLFLGSLTRGLYIFTRQPFHILTSGTEVGDEVYYAQTALGHNRLLTPQGTVFDSSGPVAVLPLLKEKSIYGDRYSLTIDKLGCIWYKSAETLYKFNSKGTELLWMWMAPSRINVLYLGADERLWISTKDAGLYCLHTAAPQPGPVLITKRLPDVSYIQQETPDLLWLGASKGLYRLQLSTHKIDSIPGFKGRHIRSLNIPQPGRVWITTYDDGFFLYRNGRLTKFPLDDKKYLSAAHCILEGDRGYCWITTNKGLFQAAKQDLLAYADGEQSYVYYQYYGKDKGFNTNEFNGGCQPCAVKWPNGNVSFPSLDGLVLFSPAKVQAELPGKGIYVDQAELNGNLLPYQDTLSLPHTFQQLKLHIGIPYFGDPYNLQVSYALIGSGDDTVWLPLANDHSLSFSTLPSGSYRLLVRKINGFGKNNYVEKGLFLMVSPAYYETIWFRLLLVLFIVIVVVTYIQLHTYHIKQQNLELETRVSARTAQLESTMASLTLSEKKLRRQTRTQERLIASITHDIKTPMKYLMMLAGNMSWKDQRELEPELIVRSSKAIYDASYRMYYMIDNLIQYIRTHVRNGSAATEEIDLYELLEEKIDVFGSIAAANNTSIINNISHDLQFCGNYQLIAVVIHNLLDNAVKYTREGEVRISAVSDGNKVAVIIEDTGTGLPPSLLHWINNYHHPNGKEEETSPSHNGMGLVIVMELLELVNGRLKAENKPHCGVEIIVEVDAC